ncbi:MAG TPA: radical SAM protein [Phycisphaerae bacterium]|nr:radical SAM protein [Phycisphaerae bacterium]
MDTQEKLKFLADASQYDLACACGTKDGPDHRRRGPGGVWLYPASVPRGGTSVLLKTLLSNACANDCRYCPFRNDRPVRRCTLAPEEVAAAFLEYARQKKVFGLFLTSGVLRDPDYTMDRMLAVAALLRRRYAYRGYLHLKIIPGASDGAIEEALGLATAVSLNVEAPTRAAFAALSRRKDFDRDIVRPMRLISHLTARGNRHHGVHQTTQFIVGASDETDADIIQATYGLYKRLGLSRVYFSAYQRGLGDPTLPGEQSAATGDDLLMREHRLYQTDWLIRKYGFSADEIPLESDGRLSLKTDPKELWARLHPERFPIDINRADRYELLRVPGLGPTTVKRILEIRRNGGRIRSVESLGRPNRRLRLAEGFLDFGRGTPARLALLAGKYW